MNYLQKVVNDYESQVGEGIQKKYISVAYFITDLSLTLFTLFSWVCRTGETSVFI